MSFKLLENQRVFLEITNPIHGGEGWEFGEVLWSPSVNRAGGDTWKLMTKVRAGDIILHSLKKGTHHFVGASVAKASYNKVLGGPPEPGRWSGYPSYYRVPLQSFSRFSRSLSVSRFTTENEKRLTMLRHPGSFYDYKFKLVQKYLVEISPEEFQVLNDYFIENGEELFKNVSIQNEDDTIDISTISGGTDIPPRIVTEIQRIIRDTAIVRSLKRKCNDRCQICGKKLILPGGNSYSEGHHLQKLGSIHQGPDIAANIIILCPYHHAEFDYGAIGIDSRNRIMHIDPENEYNGKELAYERSDLGIKYIEYHNKNIYNRKSKR